jgi:hypothetical protein
MSGRPRDLLTPRAALPLAVAAVLSIAGLIAVAVAAPRVAAGGWLLAFIDVSVVVLGALELTCIHRLSGGRWGDALRPLVEPLALCIVPLAVLFIPVLIALPALFPWSGGAPAVKPDVAALYLNSPLFVARAVIAFAGWSVLVLLLLRTGGRAGTLLAALGLIFHAVIISFVAVDWVLSVEPGFVSTSFGASVAIMQIMAALAFAAIFAPLPDEQAVRDLGGLMLAVVLGLTYIDFMAVLVMWYGDIPDKIGWFVARAASPWKWLAVAGFLLGSVLPVLALLLERVRANRSALRVAGASILAGLAFYDAYLLAPAYGAWSLATALLALVALGSVLTLFVRPGAPSGLLRGVRAAHE